MCFGSISQTQDDLKLLMESGKHTFHSLSVLFASAVKFSPVNKFANISLAVTWYYCCKHKID